MKAKSPKLINDNGTLTVIGDFTFELSPTILTADLTTIKKITFDWDVNVSQDLVIAFGEDEILEVLGDRLKQDFIKLAKRK